MTEGTVVFEREGCVPIPDPSAKELSRDLLRLRSYGPSSYASLMMADGSYVQVAGGGVGCLLERRDIASGKHYRASQDPPVVPFDDGAPLSFRGGSIPLRRGEWFRIEQVIEVFLAFSAGEPLPDYIVWRDISDLLAVSSSFEAH
jgi:hypothetical protein